MEIYAVFGVEWHMSRDLLGIFDDFQKALKFKMGKDISGKSYDDIIIVTYILNEPDN